MAEARTGSATRIAGVNIPDKHIVIALTYIYGVGRPTAKKLCDDCNVKPQTRTTQLSSEQLDALRSAISNNCMVEGDLRREVMMNIKHLRDIKCYRGLRHRRGLPVRGQNTKNNARTRKGKKRLVTK